MRRLVARPLVSFAAVLALGAAPAPPDVKPPEVGRGCPPERTHDGEVRLVFLGDSGYGSGVAEWGAHGQEAIARRIATLGLAPDLVFFLGDNIYWLGSSSLYKERFDDVYSPLIRDCKAHVALGNHDVKGCRAVEQLEHWQSCLDELGKSMVSDRKAQYVRQGMEEAAAEEKAKAEVAAETSGDVTDEAIATRRANCLPADATAYEDVVAGKGACHASDALEHAQFGFGAVETGDPPARQRQRYYSVLWPLPPVSKEGAPKEPTPATPRVRPLVDVMVLDSNTLRVHGGMLEKAGGPPREDRLQLLWLRDKMTQWVPAPGESHGIWKILAMHHPPHSPRACACRIFGKCVGGHADEEGLGEQLDQTLEGLEPPDFVFTAHNHIYARSHPLGADSEPVKGERGGVRYFVTGGGGAPLYDVNAPDRRFAKALTVYHFVYLRLTASSAFFWALDEAGRIRDSGCFDKGSAIDRPLRPDFSYDDALPPRCDVES